MAPIASVRVRPCGEFACEASARVRVNCGPSCGHGRAGASAFSAPCSPIVLRFGIFCSANRGAPHSPARRAPRRVQLRWRAAAAGDCAVCVRGLTGNNLAMIGQAHPPDHGATILGPDRTAGTNPPQLPAELRAAAPVEAQRARERSHGRREPALNRACAIARDLVSISQRRRDSRRAAATLAAARRGAQAGPAAPIPAACGTSASSGRIRRSPPSAPGVRGCRRWWPGPEAGARRSRPPLERRWDSR